MIFSGRSSNTLAGQNYATAKDYLGFPIGVSGEDLASRAWFQAERIGAEIAIPRSVRRLDCERLPYVAELSDGAVVKGLLRSAASETDQSLDID